MINERTQQEFFNEAVFNILFQYAMFIKFGEQELVKRRDLNDEEKQKAKEVLNSLEKFNQLLNKQNEEFIQHGQNDQITN